MEKHDGVGEELEQANRRRRSSVPKLEDVEDAGDEAEPMGTLAL